MDTFKRVIAIIPAYNESARIGPIMARTVPMVSEVVVVDDGSRDNTAAVARRAGVTVLELPVNRGKGAALQAGFDYALAAGADAIVTLDADGQHRPEDIPRLLAALGRDRTLGGVVGSRRAERERMPIGRRLVNVGTSWFLSQVSGQPMDDSQSGFRAYRPGLLRDVNAAERRFAAESEILLLGTRRGHRFAWVPIEAIYEKGRRSHVQPFRDGLGFLTMVWRVQSQR